MPNRPGRRVCWMRLAEPAASFPRPELQPPQHSFEQNLCAIFRVVRPGLFSWGLLSLGSPSFHGCHVKWGFGLQIRLFPQNPTPAGSRGQSETPGRAWKRPMHEVNLMDVVNQQRLHHALGRAVELRTTSSVSITYSRPRRFLVRRISRSASKASSPTRLRGRLTVVSGGVVIFAK